MHVYRNAIPKSILFFAVFALAAMCLPVASTGAGDAARIVQPVDGDIPGEIFQLEIVLSGLRHLGYTVKPAIVLPQEAGTPHLLVAQGDADFFAGHWDPLHKSFFEQVTIPIDDISAQNMRMRNGEDSQEDIERHAREWIEQHRAQFEHWVSEARKAGK